MARPSARKGSYCKSKNPHQAGNVACALFAVFKDESKARAIGNDKKSNPKAAWRQHAEPQWWNDPKNVAAYKKAAGAANLVRFEFEVSTDFCSDNCRNLFQQARVLAPTATIYVFIMREEIYYEVQPRTGEVRRMGDWN